MIYLDHHAATPVDPRVIARVADAMMTLPGNASSSEHAVGEAAAAAVQSATVEVATLIGAHPQEIVFTSGATEALNLALRGTVQALGPERVRVALGATEHAAVLETAAALARSGLVEVEVLPVDRLGHIDVARFEAACRAGARLACAMAANNEIGTIAPIANLAEIAEAYGTVIVCDAAQAAGKVSLDMGQCGITMLTLSGHKLYGPPGVGVLAIQRGHKLLPMLTGGKHQRGLRPGSLNVPGIVGLGEACRLRRLEGPDDEARIAYCRDHLEHLLLDALPEARVNGDPVERLAGNLHITIPGVPGDAIIARLRHHVALSSGSACTSGAQGPSHVLRAIGLPEAHLMGAFRFGLGKGTTLQDIECSARLFVDAVNAVRSVFEQL